MKNRSIKKSKNCAEKTGLMENVHVLSTLNTYYLLKQFFFVVVTHQAYNESKFFEIIGAALIDLNAEPPLLYVKLQPPPFII